MKEVHYSVKPTRGSKQQVCVCVCVCMYVHCVVALYSVAVTLMSWSVVD